MYILSSIRHTTFSDYSLKLFEDPRVWPHVAELRVCLAGIEERIERDELSRHGSYPYLKPSLVSLAANV